MIVTIASRFGSFSRVDHTTSNHSSALSRTASLWASCALCGSSSSSREPPSPVAVPPTEVASR